MIQKIFFVLFSFLSFSAYSQLEFSGELNLQGMYSTGENLPFWMYMNQRGRISENTNAAGWITGRAVYDLSYTSTLEVGAGILYQDGISGRVFLDESYVQFRNTWLEVIAGRKQRPELYNGLSASNENIIYSLNTRPFPGIQLRTVSPIKISSKFSLELQWEEYLLEKGRYIKNARLHHKSFRIQYKPNENWAIKYGLQHFVQWGGTRPNGIKEPQGVSDYLRIISFRAGGKKASQSDKANALGNHLGSQEIYVTRKFRNYTVEFLFNNLFEDGSGSWFGNIPDGRYGIYLNKNERNTMINSFIYEFYYTKDQSKDTRWGKDNYFNNGAYRSGWTYYNRVIGTPFFTRNPNGEGILKNAFVAHHIGISGQFSDYFNTFPYKLMLSMVQYEAKAGNFGKQSVFYGDFEMRVLQSFVDLSFNLSAEFNSLESPGFGIGLKLRKKLF
jgi:hypothetical protein